ncbi:MAG: molybdopterin-dependent oxidoreductase, partial [Anaerolineales bacterium]|nr:molybdopterin-dependent oxidoreductase [Anaerolineales bacterium]
MIQRPDFRRREFIKVSAAAGGGLLVSLFLSSCGEPQEEVLLPTAEPTAVPTPTPNPNALLEPGVFLRIDGTGAVTVTIPRPDVGQGVRTAFAMIVADELGADWASVRVEQATADSKYGNQVTGGSRGVSQSFLLLRRAGATARKMLIAAAAQVWGVPEGECRAEDGLILHTTSGDRLSFADVVETASTLPVPSREEVEYKDPSEFVYIGESMEPLDHPRMVDGSAIYGIDVDVPDMLYAVLARCPVPRGDLESYDAANAAAVEGVREIVPISNGVAVVADSTWAAIMGRQALEIIWDEGTFADLNTEALRESMTEQVVPEGWTGASTDPNEISALYEVPFLAHATPEPPSCVAHVRDGRCEIWAPTQVPMEAMNITTRAARVARDDVDMHVPIIGGGFGRRLQVDFIEEAVEIARAVGSPVKLVWTREDDLQHDFYHPFSCHYVSARLDSPALPRIRSSTFERIPTGPWRAVTNVTEAFVHESFLDEMAVALDRDPLELRLELEPRKLHPVLEKAALEADWGSELPPGWGRGIACHATWNVSPVAQVAEVSVSEEGEVRVHRVVCAIDCGLVIHPGMVKAQM